MNDSDVWNGIKQFYMETYGIEEEVVEIMANYDLIMLSASGASNTTISKFLESIGVRDITEDIVKAELTKIMNFSGWETDLLVNPYIIYTDGMGQEEFYNLVSSKLEVQPDDFTLLSMYNLCVKCAELEDKIALGWK